MLFSVAALNSEYGQQVLLLPNASVFWGLDRKYKLVGSGKWIPYVNLATGGCPCLKAREQELVKRRQDKLSTVYYKNHVRCSLNCHSRLNTYLSSINFDLYYVDILSESWITWFRGVLCDSLLMLLTAKTNKFNWMAFGWPTLDHDHPHDKVYRNSG